MRALGYLTARDLDGDVAISLEEQRHSFEEYCSQQDHRVVAVFQDHLAPVQADRPGYQEMVAFIRGSAEGFLVVIAESPVLGDSLEQVVARLLELEALKSQVVCTGPELPDPLQNALHRFQSLRNRRIRDAMAAKAVQGAGLGKPPFGYRIDAEGKLEVVPEEAQVVERIFHLYAEEGLGIRRITQALNTEATFTRSGGRWNMVAILDILRNPVYQGTYQRFGFRIPQNHPTVITSTLFRKAQDQMRARRIYRRQAQTEPFLLSGLVRCGFCGSRMIGVTRRQAWQNKDGARRRGVYRYYQCQARANQSVCDYRTRRAQELEEQVVAMTRAHLQKRRQGEARDSATVVASLSQTDVDTTAAQTAQRAWRRRWLQAVRHAAEGGMSLTRLRFVLEDLAREYARSMGAGPAPALSLDEDALLDEARWEETDFSQRQRLLRRLVGRVTVTEGECQVLLR